MYKQIFRPLAFRIDGENIHHSMIWWASRLLRCPLTRALLRAIYGRRKKEVERSFMGLHFRGLVGFAAGFDKGGELADRLETMGYAFMEVGTVTPLPQPGNPKKRIFRLIKDEALINRMGFNSEGLKVVINRLKQRKKRVIPIAGNLGKNTATTNENAAADYTKGLEELYPYVDFFVVNVSCPNVKDLRALQREDTLAPIVEALVEARQKQSTYKPILLKLGADPTEEELTYTVKVALEKGIDGFVVSNTTTHRDGLQTTDEQLAAIGAGGLSGRPLHNRALRAVHCVRSAAGKGVPIIGVGGIFSGQDALAMLQAGASLVEVYTGVIYEGPVLARKINKYLKQHEDEIPQW